MATCWELGVTLVPMFMMIVMMKKSTHTPLALNRCFYFRKLGESEAQCHALREEVKQLKTELEQWRMGGKSTSKFESFESHFRLDILKYS